MVARPFTIHALKGMARFELLFEMFKNWRNENQDFCPAVIFEGEIDHADSNYCLIKKFLFICHGSSYSLMENLFTCHAF